MKPNPSRRWLGWGLGLVLAAVLAGCASPARQERMQADPTLAERVAAAASPLGGKIGIQDVTGGSTTNPMWVSKISSSEFERALEASLRDAGLLSDNRQGAPYSLLADLVSLEQPFMGLSLTVTVTVTYRLMERASGKMVYEKTIATPHTAQFGDAFIASERLQLANEGAMRANIARLIGDLTAVKVSELVLR